MLKWTYAYFYYAESKMKDHEKPLFQLWQADLEKYTDHLSELLEKPLDNFINDDSTDRQGFYLHRSEVQNYYRNTD